MTKQNFYAITGGPGGGKTTVLAALEKIGIRYIPETARAIIQSRVVAGLPPRPAIDVFAREMFEKDLRNFTDNSAETAPLFFDRSLLDSASLLHETSIQQFDTIKGLLSLYRYNRTVFITPAWREIYVTDAERDQTFEEAVRVYKTLHAWYSLQGYNVIELPEASVGNRVAFILQHIR